MTPRGLRLIRLGEGEGVVSVVRVAESEEEGEAEGVEGGETPPGEPEA